MPSHALRLFGSEATTAFQLNRDSSCCPSSSSSDAKSHRARISVGHTARSFCNSIRRSIDDSFGMGRTHSISRIDERMGQSSDIRSPDDADPVDSSGAFNRLSSLTSRSTSYTVASRIKGMSRPNVQAAYDAAHAYQWDRDITNNLQLSDWFSRGGGFIASTMAPEKSTCENAVQGRCRGWAWLGVQGWRE